MVYRVIGTAGDQTADWNVIIRDYVKTNWGLTGELDDPNIIFGVGWNQMQADVEIHFKMSTPAAIRTYTLGQTGFQRFDDLVYVHTFITNTSPNSEPPNYDNVGKVYRELVRLVNQNPTALSSQGIIKMLFHQPPYTVPEEDALQTTFHGIGIIGLFYLKADV